jgi:hypothetical protein
MSDALSTPCSLFFNTLFLSRKVKTPSLHGWPHFDECKTAHHWKLDGPQQSGGSPINFLVFSNRHEGYDDPGTWSRLYGVEEPMFPGGSGKLAPGQVAADCSKTGEGAARDPVFPNGVNMTVQDAFVNGPKLAICTSTSAGLDQVSSFTLIWVYIPDSARSSRYVSWRLSRKKMLLRDSSQCLEYELSDGRKASVSEMEFLDVRSKEKLLHCKLGRR